MKRSAIQALLRLRSPQAANTIAYLVEAKPRNPYGRNEASRQELATPRWFFERVQQAYQTLGDFALDTCAQKNSAVCDRYFTRRQNGLEQDWSTEGLNWCNPPFSQARQWLDKAFTEARRGCSTVMLLPFRDPAARWFFGYAPFAERITVVVPRLQYYQCGGEGFGFNDNASFCSALWLVTPDGLARAKKNRRQAVIDWWNVGKRPQGARR
jgi:site-specific DNA-methyltransferase (adenine-specific)